MNHAKYYYTVRNYCEENMRILIVEDEHILAETLKEVLIKKGYEAKTAEDGITGLELIKTDAFDLIILDVLLPGIDGIQVVKNARAAHIATPILMLTAKTQIDDRVEGLDAGADYYMPKPFDLRELLACINALLRRDNQSEEGYSFGNTFLNTNSTSLSVGQNAIRLSAREFEVARILFSNKEKNSSKQQLIDKVWGPNSYYSENNAEVYIGFLRKKLASLNSNVSIVASRGLGYHLEETPCQK